MQVASNNAARDRLISRRVFCIGMNKTGTSTIKHCFGILGIGPIASPKTYNREQRDRVHRFYRHKNYVDMLRLAEDFQAFEDRPWNMWSMYRHLHERFPDSLFILTTRAPESWWRSTEQWITVTKPKVLTRYQLHLRAAQLEKDAMIDGYLRYNEEVQNYFSNSGQFLIMNVEQGDSWEKLCGFLGVSVPANSFPHANRQTYTADDAKAFAIERRLKRGFKCQSCNEVRPAGGKQKGTKGSVPQYVRTMPARIWRTSRANRRRYMQNSVTIRRLAYTLNHLRFRKNKRDALYNDRPSICPSKVEFAVVTCFFNPTGSKRRVQNFQTFLAAMRGSGVRCLVVELAFGANPFVVSGHEDILRFRSDHIMWHKERLLNIGIQQLLSDGVRKIAWLDGDIVFEDTRWPQEISSKLDKFNLCQVFETVKIMSNDGPAKAAPSSVKYYLQYGRVFRQYPTRRNLLHGMLLGGQSGFGWAARAEILQQVPLFEHAIVGGGDKFIMAASLTDSVLRRSMKNLTRSHVSCKSCGHRNMSTAFTDDYLGWANRWSAVVDRSVGYARLRIKDLYHGQRSDRAYRTRHEIMFKHEFDPAEDLSSDSSNCLMWTDNTHQLRHDVEAYFLSRREDL